MLRRSLDEWRGLRFEGDSVAGSAQGGTNDNPNASGAGGNSGNNAV